MKSKKNLKSIKKSDSGITLIALVITIVVLLIMTSVTLLMISGENGILTKAIEAKQKNEEARLVEEESLKNLESEIDEYTTGAVNFKKIMKNIQSNMDYYLGKAQELGQDSTNLDIGIGTDGKIVNLDLWVYRSVSDSYIALNSEDSCGYLHTAYDNSNIVDGKIQGTIPQYIYVYSLDKFLPVTNLDYTFYNCSSLVEAPKIPSTVTSMFGTFRYCTSLVNSPEIPDGVTNMASTFDNCGSLLTTPKLPSGITSLDTTFYDCHKITELIIPENVTSIGWRTFSFCSNLNLYFEHTESLPEMHKDAFYAGSSIVYYFKNSTMADAFNTYFVENEGSTPNISDNYNW